MRGHGTAYLAESVKFFSPTRVFRDHHAALTSVTKKSQQPGGPTGRAARYNEIACSPHT